MENRQYENMVKIFEKTKIFDPSKSHINAEIRAWSAGFSMLSEEVDKVLNNFFISTCDEDALKKFENLTNSTPLGTLEQRKMKVLSKYKFYEYPSTKKSLEEKIKGIGVQCEIVEDGETQCTINISAMTNILSEEFEEFIKREFPINFSVNFNYA